MVRGRASLVFILDSLMISGLRWVLDTVTSAADAEMNDDTALREQLMDAAMRRALAWRSWPGNRAI